jgi:filamentous hemagglutinin family protein
MLGITQDWWWGCSLVMGGILIASSPECVFAQITPDGTLPNNSIVTPDGSTINITGGTRAGKNLFHSFGEFSIPTGGTASFNNAVDIQNIISRVTGGSVSNIDGIISTKGTANLFLINPNGIIFGQNAQLNVGGSFVATTASAIAFGNQGLFSASNPESSSLLLTVNPSALLFNQIKTASIENNSVVRALRVPDGKSLLLVGGDINMDGGSLVALGGRVELGGLAGTGTVALKGDSNNLSLSFPDSVEKSDVFLSNSAGVYVAASDGGSIAVNTRNLEMTGESFLFAGIENGLGSDNSKAGNIEVNATRKINLNNSYIVNQVLPEANGQGGDVSINASTLLVRDGALVSASTFGAGKGGSLTVDTQDVQLIGGDSQVGTGLFVSAQPNSTGDAGNLSVKTNTLLVRDRAQIGTDTFGTGKGGNLIVDAQDVQLISGDSQFTTGLSATAQPNSTGDAGDLSVKTNTLLVRDGAQVNAGSFGEGNGGNLTVNASQAINLIGRRSRLSAQTQGSGASGNLQISTKQLTVQDGAQISASSFAQGQGGSLFVNASEFVELIGKSPDSSQVVSGLFAQAQGAGAAGNLAIATGKLIVRDGAGISTTTYGQGQGGNLSVNASGSIELIGGGGLSTQAQDDGVAGNLTIATGKLIVRNSSQVLTTTYGQGQGGSLSVNASDSVELIGKDSSLFADTQGDGAAGNLTITTGKLIVRDEAQVFTGTAGKGQGGSLSVNALESVEISSSEDSSRVSSLSTITQGAGAAGNLTITTGKLTLKDRSQVSVASEGTGKAGNLDLTVPFIVLDGNQAALNAQTASGNGGNIRLQNLDLLLLRRGAQISTTAGTAEAGGNGGNITINAPSGFIIAVPSENSDITANAFTGIGGRVDIKAFGIYGIQFRESQTFLSDITASSEFGTQGTVELNTSDIDPNSGLLELPAIPVDTEVAQGCYSPGYAQNRFVITGRGGLPANPKDILTPDAPQIDWVSLKPSNSNRSLPPITSKLAVSTPQRIVEATGAVLNTKGQIVLSANSSTATPPTSKQNPIQCNGR